MSRIFDVLIIDDDPKQIKLIRARLNELSLSYTCHYALSGEQALDFLNCRPPFETAPRPKLILLSLHRSGSREDEVLHAIKSNAAFCAIPLMVLSASPSLRDLETTDPTKAESAGACDLESRLVLLEEIDRFWGTAAELSR